jgi:ATP-dependent DNA ligase
MLLQRTETLPEAAEWLYQLKIDGYRALAFKTGGRMQLRSWNDKDFTLRYPDNAKALSALPDDTVIDEEVVALDESGRRSFNILQNYGRGLWSVSSSASQVLLSIAALVLGKVMSVQNVSKAQSCSA